jgi:hypothetical protein
VKIPLPVGVIEDAGKESLLIQVGRYFKRQKKFCTKSDNKRLCRVLTTASDKNRTFTSIIKMKKARR